MSAVILELAADPSHFTPTQLQHRALIAISFNAMNLWTWRRFGSPHSRIVYTDRVGFVCMGLHVVYLEPLTYEQASMLTVVTNGVVQSDGIHLQLTMDFRDAERAVARVHIVMAPLRLSETEQIDGRPAFIPQHLRSRLDADELDDATYSSPVPRLVKKVEAEETLIATGEHRLRIHRHNCEVADQWWFAEVPRFVGAAREELARRRADEGGGDDLLRTLGMRLSTVDWRLRRPFYLFDEMVVSTAAYRARAGFVFVHQLRPAGRQEPHPNGTVVEVFSEGQSL